MTTVHHHEAHSHRRPIEHFISSRRSESLASEFFDVSRAASWGVGTDSDSTANPQVAHPHFKRNYLQHALAVRHWMCRHRAVGAIDPLSHVLQIRCEGRARRFHPHFVLEQRGGEIEFTPQPTTNVNGFESWLPYFNKSWPVGQDKLAFKEFATRSGIRTPHWATDPAQSQGAFVIKRRFSSPGRDTRGPFEDSSGVTLSAGEFCERFVVGQLLRAWFWNQEVAVVELADMPTVRGDGERTLRQLINSKAASTELKLSDLVPLAAMQGLSLDGIVPARRTALADYRHASALNPANLADHNVRRRLVGSELESQLLHAGGLCWAAIPEGFRQGTAFSLDGIVDPEGTIWFLNANCNPALHPAFYESMLNEIFLTGS
jgi:hypothetical protein